MRAAAVAAAVLLTVGGCADASPDTESARPTRSTFDRPEKSMPVGLVVVSSGSGEDKRYDDGLANQGQGYDGLANLGQDYGGLANQGQGYDGLANLGRSNNGGWTLFGGSRAYKKWFLCGDLPDAPSGEISISVPRGDETYFVRMTARGTGKRLAEVIVSPGQKTVISVPICDVGRSGYDLYYGAGTKWYGYKFLFGPEGAYSRADKVFTFENGTVWAVSLTLQTNGNLANSKLGYHQFVR